MKAFIYKIVNKVNGKFYIGSTIRKKHIRKYEHLSQLRKRIHTNSHLQSAFNKYGEPNFEFLIVEDFLFPATYSKSYILEYILCREIYLINYLKADYNQRLQEDCRLQYTHSQETRDKISKANAGVKRKCSPEWLEKIRANAEKRKGVKKRFSPEWLANIKLAAEKRIGSKHTPEAIEKISIRSRQQDNVDRIRKLAYETHIKNIGVPRSYETKVKIAESKIKDGRIIEIYNIDGSLFNTAKFSQEASDLTGVKRAAISNNLCGLTKSTKMFIFKYKEVSIGEL